MVIWMLTHETGKRWDRNREAVSTLRHCPKFEIGCIHAIQTQNCPIFFRQQPDLWLPITSFGTLPRRCRGGRLCGMEGCATVKLVISACSGSHCKTQQRNLPKLQPTTRSKLGHFVRTPRVPFSQTTVHHVKVISKFFSATCLPRPSPT